MTRRPAVELPARARELVEALDAERLDDRVSTAEWLARWPARLDALTATLSTAERDELAAELYERSLSTLLGGRCTVVGWLDDPRGAA